MENKKITLEEIEENYKDWAKGFIFRYCTDIDGGTTEDDIVNTLWLRIKPMVKKYLGTIETQTPNNLIVLSKDEYKRLKTQLRTKTEEAEYRARNLEVLEKDLENLELLTTKTVARKIYFDYESYIKNIYGAYDRIDSFSVLEWLKETCNKYGAELAETKIEEDD